MSTKKVLLSIFSIFTLAGVFSYSLVFAGGLGKITFKKSNNIILDSISLNENRIILNSRENPEDFKISGDCQVFGKLVKSENNFHVFDIKILDKNCKNSRVDVYFYLGESFLKTRFNLITTKDYYNQFLDLNNLSLNKVISKLNKNINKLKKYEDYTLNSGVEYLDFLNKNRQLEEIKYTKEFIENILLKRTQKYKIPVEGYNLPTKPSKVPNAGRPYREKYTNGIHESWDIDADLGKTVVSLDDGIVYRVVNDWMWSDFSNLKYGELTDEEKALNLDILRGNQVWIKTMKGDIVFYNHLDVVYSNIKEGDLISRGNPIGTIGVTGVPEKGYSDYHLDFSIRKNPYSGSKYSNLDIMFWDWYLKGKKYDEVIEKQWNYFEK